MQLNKVALGIACGLILGGAVCLVTLLVAMRGDGEHLALLSRFYIGYRVSIPGAFIGLVYGCVSGFLGGWIFGGLYNLFAPRR